MTAIHLTAAALTLTGTISAFSPPSHLTLPRTSSSFTHHRIPRPLYNSEINNLQEEDLTALSINPTLNLLPAGYGFSTTMDRVIGDVVSGGYYKADVGESVIDVMEGILKDGNADVALVFEGEELRGLFTDSDYIKVCT
jgi:hypothetical protein